VKLARYALGEVNGAIQQSKVQRDVIILSTRYTRERKNGGHTEVTIIAAVDRKPARLEPMTTMVELSAWAIDVEPSRTGLASTGRSPRDLPTLSTTSPTTVSSSQQQPYRITRDDTEHWNKLEDVLNTLIDVSTRKP
jgi:hypothetical protein